MQELDRESLVYDDVLRHGGHLLAAQALRSVHEAVTIRTRAGKASVTDGPFAEAREQIGGFILLEVRDLKEAVELASAIPVASLGAVEVRSVYELQP